MLPDRACALDLQEPWVVQGHSWALGTQTLWRLLPDRWSIEPVESISSIPAAESRPLRAASQISRVPAEGHWTSAKTWAARRRAATWRPRREDQSGSLDGVPGLWASKVRVIGGGLQESSNEGGRVAEGHWQTRDFPFTKRSRNSNLAYSTQWVPLHGAWLSISGVYTIVKPVSSFFMLFHLIFFFLTFIWLLFLLPYLPAYC